MKKFIQLSAIFFGLIMSQNAYSQLADQGSCCAPVAQDSCCVAPADKPCGEQYILMCKQEPQYYNDWKCVEEKIPCKKQCVRCVPQYYEVEKCRYVPQTYKETCCRYVKECYEVDDCKTCKKWVCEKKCKLVPKYYWKHQCAPQCSQPSSCSAN